MGCDECPRKFPCGLRKRRATPTNYCAFEKLTDGQLMQMGYRQRFDGVWYKPQTSSQKETEGSK